MENYGSTFRELRQNKGYTLKEVAAGIMSVTALSNFENGISDIKSTNLFKLLFRIQVSTSEFLYTHDQFGNVDLNRIIQNIESARNSNEDAALTLRNLGTTYQTLYLRTQEKHFQYVAILCEYMADPECLSSGSKRVLQHYLLNVKRFDEFEFYLMQYLSEFFTTTELAALYRRMDKDITNLSPFTKTNRHHIYINRCFHLIRRSEVKLARLTLDAYKRIEPIPKIESIEKFILARFLDGLIQIAEGKSEGESLCRESLHAFSILDGFEDALAKLDSWIAFAKDLNMEGATV